MSFNKEIFSSAENSLALRMHSISELREKLKKKFPKKQEESEEVIRYFIDAKVLDDQEFTRIFLQYRQSQKPKSTYFLRMELQKKGIEKEIIDSGLKEYPMADDAESAFTLAEIKLQSLPHDLGSQKKKEKIFRYLQLRGFSYGIIKEVWEKMGQ